MTTKHEFPATDFAPGQRVVYKGKMRTAAGTPFAGQRWEHPSLAAITFEATPENLTPLA